MAFTGKPTGQINTLPMYGAPGQSQIGNYGSQPGRGFGIDQALAMRNYLDTLAGTRPRKKLPTLPMAFMYGYLDNGGY